MNSITFLIIINLQLHEKLNTVNTQTIKLIYYFFFATLFYSCSEVQQNSSNEPLPSWNESASKQNILDYVTDITNEGSENFISPKDRIVCFDNDGTLWTEQPLPNQIYFTFDRLREMAIEDPTLANQLPYKAVLENNTDEIAKLKPEDIVGIVAKVNATNSLDSFDASVKNWFATKKHPRYDRSFEKITYQPMLELLDYLRAQDFKIFIVSGGSVEFMRPVTDKLYGIPSQNVIGSRMKLETERDGVHLNVERKAELAWNDDREGKVTSIAEFIGRKPVMVVGNSDGDLAMMEYAVDQDKKTLMVYLKHTDGEREYDYSDGVLAGALKEGEQKALEKGWTIIDMKTDWKTIFSD